jgi:rubrerythrin
MIMVTMVGKQAEFGNAVIELIELEYDATEAYEAAISRIENTVYKGKLSEFLNDHRRHIEELSLLLKKHGYAVPQRGILEKSWLTKGKVVLANLIGDATILSAMLSNEKDTNTAYERMNERTDKWDDAKDILQRGLEDERRHKNWCEMIQE